MRAKNILTTVLFGAMIFGFPIVMLLAPKKDYSMSERRVLAEFPEVTKKSLSDGSFMKDFESWSLDRFPLRDAFRTLKAYSSRNIFMQKDNNGFYMKKGCISRLEYPLNTERLEINAGKLDDVYNKFIKDRGGRVYLSVIPDKNYFTAPKAGCPTMDYDLAVGTLRDKLDFAEYIDIFDTLDIECYYRTDQHWRQEKITGTAKRLAESMGSGFVPEFEEKTATRRFYGTYSRQSALLTAPDSLSYLTNPVIEGCKVTGYDTGAPKELSVYDMDKASGRDPYEMYLCGSQAVMTVENPVGDKGRKLIVFRDSFGSSIVPLLIQCYSEITLVDLRYVQSGLLGSLIDFSDRDVLFLYSTLVLNNSIAI